MAFTEKYLFNMDGALANMVISHMIKDHFKLKTEDVRALLSCQKKLAKEYREKAEANARASEAGDLPDWYEVTRAGLVFLPAVLASHMAKTENVFYAAEQYYRYQGGVYKPISDLEARNMVRLKMDERYTRMHQINDAEGQWKLQIGRDARLLNPNPYIINVLNGMYNVMEDTLEPHSPDYLSTVQLGVNYVKDAKCPRFEQFLAESIEPDQIPLVQEMLGYFLVPVNRAQKCFVIVGAAGAGKSKLLLVINEVLLGRENVSNVSWQALNERFKTAELFGKLANIFADLPTKNIDDNGIFKALVGEDYLTVERKNKDPFSFVSQARLLFSCNNIPRNYGDRSDGFYRRLIIIRFSHSVPEALRDPDLLSKFQAESDGIFQYALVGLRRLMANGFRFSETESNKQELRKYREDSNSVLAFIRDCCVLEKDAEIGRAEVYQRYRSYCEESGLNPFSQRMFNTEIDTNFPSIKRERDPLARRKTWRGIKLLSEMDQLD
jgi:putative DNA primase/helicase